MGSSGGHSTRRPRRALRWAAAFALVLPAAGAAGILFAPGPGTGGAAGAQELRGAGEAPGYLTVRETFPICRGSRRFTCVVDGDTIWYRGEKIRVADIDTPETFRPSCERERQVGERATRRLQQLLNAGEFALAPNPEGRSRDRYGRALMVLERGGESLGERLVREGLAERWGGPRREWCTPS